MRQKISYSSGDYSGSVAFWILMIGLVFCCFFWWTPSCNYSDVNTATSSGCNWATFWGWVILGILFFWWICALCFTPIDVNVDDNEVKIRRPLKSRRIKMSEIQSAEPYQVPQKPNGKAFRSMPVRTFGHWGHYHDDNIGDYFAYYGKPENTVLITLKDGRKYVVGGSDAKALADAINSKISK